MSEKQDPVQTQLIAVRRSQILDAAVKVFAEKGFHGTTIRQIATEAGLADGTIYIYFKNKTDLLIGIMNRLNQSDQRQENFEESAQTDIRTFFRLHMRQRFIEIDADFQIFRAILPDILNNAELRTLYYEQVVAPTYGLAEPFFQQWIDQSVLKSTNVALTMRAISSMVLGLLVLRMLGDPMVEQQWSELPDVLTDLLLGD